MISPPRSFKSEEELDEFISDPPENVVSMMKRIPGDIAVLGIGGKIGVHLGMMLVKATAAAGKSRRIFGVSRFTDPGSRKKLDSCGIETISCDLLDGDSTDALPDAETVIFMAGKKFGTSGSEDLTWAMNTIAPYNICRRYSKSRIVAYSTGCVYPLMSASEGGCAESVLPRPVGDYAMSALGRERVFSYYAGAYGTKVCIFRLNYACEMRYGVLHDIARDVMEGRQVDCTSSHVNVIWQGDAVAYSLLCIEQCSSPAEIINSTGPEILSVRELAGDFARRLGLEAKFTGTEGPAYLNNASKSFSLFGHPRIKLDTMMDWTIDWIRNGGRSLGKPTHFQTSNGVF